MWLLDVSEQLKQLAGESEALSKAASKALFKLLHSFIHSTEGFATDWARVVAGRLVTGGCLEFGRCVCVGGGVPRGVGVGWGGGGG